MLDFKLTLSYSSSSVNIFTQTLSGKTGSWELFSNYREIERQTLHKDRKEEIICSESNF